MVNFEQAQTGKLLSEEEAQKEANLVRAKMGMNPVWGTIEKGKAYSERDGQMETVNGEPSADDYKKASQAIDELKRLVEEETTAEKVLYALARTAQTSAKAVGLVMASLGDLLSGDFAAWSTVSLLKKFEEAKKMFWDEAKELRELEKEAKRYKRDN
jgi:hypothetical protein